MRGTHFPSNIIFSWAKTQNFIFRKIGKLEPAFLILGTAFPKSGLGILPPPPSLFWHRTDPSINFFKFIFRDSPWFQIQSQPISKTFRNIFYLNKITAIRFHSPFELWMDCIDLLELLRISFDFGLLFVVLLDRSEFTESGTRAWLYRTFRFPFRNIFDKL